MGRTRSTLVPPLTVFAVGAAGAIALGHEEAAVAVLSGVAAAGVEVALTAWSKKMPIAVH